MDVLAMEERILQRQLDDGEIDIADFNRQLREAETEYSWHAHEAAHRAYNFELERW